jgi:pyoverdine/dityrosine biosynthesis protein Dit1
MGQAVSQLQIQPNADDAIAYLLAQRCIGGIGPANQFSGALASSAELLALRNQIGRAMAGTGELPFIILGFPAKSSNRDKTLSHLPDLGELVAVQRLCQLVRGVSIRAGLRGRLIIASDGHVFNDLVGVPDCDVDAYRQAVINIMEHEALGVETQEYSLSNAYGVSHSSVHLRRQLMADFGRPSEAIRQQAELDPGMLNLVNGIHRFIFEDRLAQVSGRSRNQLRIESRSIAYQVIQRSAAFSRLAANVFPDAIRLSIHPHPVGSGKLGIQLVPSASKWATPWHNVPVWDGSRIELMHHRSARQLGAVMQFHKQRFAYLSTHQGKSLW